MYSQMSKCISLLSPAHTDTVQDSLHLHASNASHIFLEPRIFSGHLPTEGC